jgi:ABC-type nitrate/sulfonate/bicarbonate transport system substrate-binding protein
MVVSLVLVMIVGSGIGVVFILGPQHHETVQTDSITLGLMPSEVETLIYVARDQGYFTDNNLNVTLKNYTTGLLAVNGLLNNEVTMATAADFVVVGKAMANKSVTAIGTIDKYSTSYLLVRTDMGISKISDLEGQRIGVPMGTVAEFNLGRFLELHGIGLNQVTFVNTPVNLAPKALINGSVGAVMTAEPYMDRITSSPIADNVLSWPAQSDTATDYLALTNSSWASNHPDTIIRFLRALDKAEDFVIHYTDVSKQALCNDLNYTSNYTEKIWNNHQFTLSLDQTLILRMEDQSRWMIRNNLTSNPVPNFLNYVYIDGLESVDPGTVNIIR